MTRAAAYLRCFLIVLISMLGAFVADQYLATVLPRYVFSLAGIVIAGLASWRAWLDQSSSINKADEKAEEIKSNTEAVTTSKAVTETTMTQQAEPAELEVP